MRWKYGSSPPPACQGILPSSGTPAYSAVSGDMAFVFQDDYRLCVLCVKEHVASRGYSINDSTSVCFYCSFFLEMSNS